MESPSIFLERLMEAYRRYTPFDPSSEGQQVAVAMAFIGQSASDIKRKLQRLEGQKEAASHRQVPDMNPVFVHSSLPATTREPRSELLYTTELSEATSSCNPDVPYLQVAKPVL